MQFQFTLTGCSDVMVLIFYFIFLHSSRQKRDVKNLAVDFQKDARSINLF